MYRGYIRSRLLWLRGSPVSPVGFVFKGMCPAVVAIGTKLADMRVLKAHVKIP